MEVKDILTMILALYGASLSTLNYLAQIRSKNWRIAASCSLGLRSGKSVVVLHAVNFGERNVALRNIWIELVDSKNWLRRVIETIRISRNRHLVQVTDERVFSQTMVLKYDPTFPIDLAPGKSVEVVINERALLRFLRESWGNRVENIVGVFEDETGKSYKTGQLHVDFQGKRINFFYKHTKVLPSTKLNKGKSR